MSLVPGSQQKLLFVLCYGVKPHVHLFILSAFADSHSLVGLFALGATGAGAAVVSLDDEGVLLLQLAVHQAAGPQLALAGRPVQHHRLERSLQPVDVERTDFPWRTESEKKKKKERHGSI